MFIIKYKNKESNIVNEDFIKHDSIKDSNNKPVWVKADGSVVNFDDVTDAVEAVMQHLAQFFPSIETIIKHKDIIYTDDPHIRTMATDGVSIFINPAFAEYLINLDEDEGVDYIEYVLIHEALHILFDHCNESAKSKDQFSDFEKINIAQDMEINYIIENFLRHGPGTKPFKGFTKKLDGCYNEEYGKKGLTWEEIYPKIPNITRAKKPEKTSDEWKRGFSDGYKEVIEKLKKEMLIERCVTM